jgi:dipeptidyl aminopeptidase/acylaminoacyl peptidase
MGAGLYLRGRQDVDGKRIGIWGGSYGGYLTRWGCRARRICCGWSDIHGVHDWNTGIKNFVPTYNPLDYPKESKLAFDSSPMASVDGWRSPVLMIHGDDDRNVNFNETVTLMRALRERKVEVEQLVFPDEIHGFLLHRSWVSAFSAAADFFDRKTEKVTRRLCPNRIRVGPRSNEFIRSLCALSELVKCECLRDAKNE